MSTQLLVNVFNVTLGPLGALTQSHGLVVAGAGVVPTQVLCDRLSGIAIAGMDATNLYLVNTQNTAQTAFLRAEFDHSIHADGATPIRWRGWDGTARPAGPAGGDLFGSYPDPSVGGLATYPLDLTPPVNGDYLRFDGTTWRHTLVTPGSSTAIYGSFSSDVDQSIGLTPRIVTFNITENSNGVSVVAGTKLTVSESGVYGVDISPQLAHSGGGTETITFWLRVNGLDLPRSASSLEMGNNNNRTLPFLQIDLPLNAGQYVEWVFVSTTATNLSLEHFPAQLSPPAAFAIPEIPSVIANVKRIGSL